MNDKEVGKLWRALEADGEDFGDHAEDMRALILKLVEERSINCEEHGHADPDATVLSQFGIDPRTWLKINSEMKGR